jgi:hypothetical protein
MAMVNETIPSNKLPVASQRSRACREVVGEGRDITFPVSEPLEKRAIGSLSR